MASRWVMTLAAITATLGGWLALATSDAPNEPRTTEKLPAIPTLEPTSPAAAPAATLRALTPSPRRPVVVSRSSR